MKALDNLKAWLINRFGYSAYSTMSPQGILRASDAESLVNDHFRGWVYICASMNAQTIAGIPLRLYVRGGSRTYYGKRRPGTLQRKHLESIIGKGADDVEEITEGHPLLDLIDDMNGEMSRSEVMEATVTWQEVTGDAYWYLEPGALDRPESIWPLMSQYTTVVRNDDGELTGYLYGKDRNKRISLEASEVIHFRYPNPRNQDYGLSPLEATFGAAVLLESQQEYEQKMYDSGGVPQTVMVVKSAMSAEDRKRLYSEWRSRFGSQRKGEKFIIAQGDTDIKTIGLPPKDVGVQFSQKFSREEIHGAFGVPMTLTQINEAAKAGAVAGNHQYMAMTIQPKLQRIAEKLTERLAHRYDDRLFFAFDNPVLEDKEHRLAEIETRLGTKMTSINEERAIDGLEPVEWGEEPEKPAPNPFAMPTASGDDTDDDDDDKALVKTAASERSFRRELQGYFGKYRDECVRRIRESE